MNNTSLLKRCGLMLPAVFCCIQAFAYKKNNASPVDSGSAEITTAKEEVAPPAAPAKQMEEVVITGQYAPTNAEKTVHKIKVIDRRKIDAMNAQNLRDVLSNEMNIRFSQDNILGSGMSMQGVSGENVKILVDGVPVIGRQNGNIDLAQLNLNNIERIEIVEGPMSVNYGTNALAGTINLITKRNQKNEWDAGLTGYYESIGTYNLNAKAGYSKGAHTLLLSGGRNFFDGWNPGEPISFDFSPAIADEKRFSQWKPKEQQFGDLQYIYKFDNTSINYKGAIFRENIVNLGMPRQPYGETAFDDNYYTERRDNAIYLSSKLNKGKGINVLAAYNLYDRVKNTYYRDLTTLSSQLTTNEGEQDTSKFKLFNSRGTFADNRNNTKINYEVGYDINYETAEGLRIKDKVKQIGDYAAFASAEYKPADNLTIRPGLRYAYNTVYKAPLVPSVNLRYKITNTGIVIRVSYAKGFRSPTLKEQYFYFYDANHKIKGNEDLKAEYSDNYNLNIGYNTAMGSNTFLKAEFGGYYNDIRNRISLAQATADEYSYTNIGRFKSLGLQANAELKINRLTLSAGGAYIGRYNELSETETGVKQFAYSPELRASINYDYPKAGLSAAVFYKYTGKTPSYGINANSEVEEIFISAYHIADLTLSKSLFNKRVILGIGCKNLFDVGNINISSPAASGAAHSNASTSMSYGTGRSYFAKVDFNLNGK